MTWYIQEKDMNALNKYAGLLFYILIFLGCMYLNIYVLTPRFLLRNKWFIYFSSLIGLVLLFLILMVLVQDLFYEEETKPIQHIDYFVSIVNLLSAVLSLTLFFAGTTTFVLFKYWLINVQKANELQTATLQSELKLLENQINPHFLFNMLNNANIMIHEDPDLASHIIVKLEDMLRYQMNDSTKEKVYLSEDITFLTDYLELEKTRRDYFEYTISQEGNLKDIQIPPLLFITFVENAVKHNLDSEAPSFVHISFKIAGDRLIFRCENSIPLKPNPKKTGGLGLINIKRRLDLLYGNDYVLEQTKTDTIYMVCLEINPEGEL
ncbi:MAG: histidine kinase [Tannerella sp.]|nr:histidine kinase [Tannerella sp.]